MNDLKDQTTDKDLIVMEDWAGNVLFRGHYTDKQVDIVLDTNRCICKSFDYGNDESCEKCEGSGYSGDFSVQWEDPKDTRNVYEFINY